MDKHRQNAYYKGDFSDFPTKVDNEANFGAKKDSAGAGESEGVENSFRFDSVHDNEFKNPFDSFYSTTGGNDGNGGPEDDVKQMRDEINKEFDKINQNGGNGDFWSTQMKKQKPGFQINSTAKDVFLDYAQSTQTQQPLVNQSGRPQNNQNQQNTDWADFGGFGAKQANQGAGHIAGDIFSDAQTLNPTKKRSGDDIDLLASEGGKETWKPRDLAGGGHIQNERNQMGGPGAQQQDPFSTNPFLELGPSKPVNHGAQQANNGGSHGGFSGFDDPFAQNYGQNGIITNQNPGKENSIGGGFFGNQGLVQPPQSNNEPDLLSLQL